MIQYHESPLSDGKTRDVYGANRLPWEDVHGSNNFDSLIALKVQVHVYCATEHSLNRDVLRDMIEREISQEA